MYVSRVYVHAVCNCVYVFFWGNSGVATVHAHYCFTRIVLRPSKRIAIPQHQVSFFSGFRLSVADTAGSSQRFAHA